MAQKNTNVFKKVNIAKMEGSIAKCWQWFFSYPTTKIGLTDLAASIGSSKTNTKIGVEYLLNIQFLNREIIGKAWLLSANQKHPYFVTKKIPINIMSLYETGVIEIVHKSFPSARTIILFGSYRWGTDTENSDIDIAVEVLDNNEMKIIKLGKIPKLGYRKNITVNLHIFSRNKIDLNLFANIANGIVLDGFLEVRP